MTVRIGRRDFITLLGGAAAWPLAARAQQPERMRRIGVLMNGTATEANLQSYVAAFAQGLRQLGWIEGESIRIHVHWSAGDTVLAKTYAAQLIGQGPFGRSLAFSGLQERSIAGRAPRRPIPSCRPWPESAVAAGLLVAFGQWQGWGGHFGASRTIFRPETRSVSLQNMRFPLAAMRGSRRRVKFIENLSTGERHSLEWGGVRLRIDQQHDPALLFRCFG